MARQDDKSGPVTGPILIEDSYLSKFMRGFVTVAAYSDEACTIPASPSAGSYTVEVRYKGSAGFLELQDSPFLATDLSSFGSWQGPVEEIKVTPNGVTGAAFIKVSYSATSD